ncbi:MAG TPA: enoyl-CoA hydratase-related protein, partial [Acidimicrobiia bacterium]
MVHELPQMDEVGFTRDGPVGRLTLRRPDKLNAQTPAMWLHMAELGDCLLGEAGAGLRVVVVEGEGRSFSAGIDITAFTGGAAEAPGNASGGGEAPGGASPTTTHDARPAAKPEEASGGGEAPGGASPTTTHDARPAAKPEEASGGVGEVASVMRLQRAFMWPEEAPFLTIAKVQGHALGAGMQLALACDVRIAADDCQMGLLETRWGLM